MINHIISYGEGLNHTNTIENAFSLLKRGVYGTFHKVSIKHLGRYCNEFRIDSIGAEYNCRCLMGR
jgi:ISXO2-like transposase domain